MSWEEWMFAVLDDLEQQASGLHLAERDVEVADLTVEEYSRVSLASRVHASLGQELQVRLLGGRVVGGRLARLGEDWLLLVDGTVEWVVCHQGMATIGGLSRRADSEETWSPVDRLSLRAVLRRLALGNERCVVHLCDDQQVEGSIGRVGRDFFELVVGEGLARATQAVPNGAVAALRASR